MKKSLSVLFVILLVASTLCLTACGPDGTYDLVSVTSNGEDYTSRITQAGGVTMVIVGSSATMSGGGQTTSFTIDTKTQTLTAPDGSSAPYTLSGNEFILEQNGARLVFKKR
jgi:hypothetical protein